MTDEPLTCREFVELVTDYLEGAMPPDETRRFEEHLALCPGCHTYLEEMKQTIRMVGTLPAESIPAAAQDELLAAFRRWKKSRGPQGADQG